MPKTPPVVLTIAGFDPSSGAGVTADVKTAAAHGCYAAACITALTVQSTQGVSRVEPVSGKLVGDTLQRLAEDLEFAAVRLGMLGSAEVVGAVADFLEFSRPPNVVVDPVLKASSGADLLDTSGVKLLIQRLLPLCDVLTPNIDEAAALTRLPVADLAQMKAAAVRLHEMGARQVVITGGHLDPATDLLSSASSAGPRQEELRSAKLVSRSTHGTGCAFATALACNLALRKPLREAVHLAKGYVADAIEFAYPLGKGTGPINHLYGITETEK